MRYRLICCALCAVALQASAQETIYRCVDSQGVIVLTDRPCEALAQGQLQYQPVPMRPAVVKEHYTLPPSEAGRQGWVRKPPVSAPPRVDVETLRLARQTLELRDKIASAR